MPDDFKLKKFFKMADEIEKCQPDLQSILANDSKKQDYFRLLQRCSFLGHEILLEYERERAGNGKLKQITLF